MPSNQYTLKSKYSQISIPSINPQILSPLFKNSTTSIILPFYFFLFPWLIPFKIANSIQFLPQTENFTRKTTLQISPLKSSSNNFEFTLLLNYTDYLKSTNYWNIFQSRSIFHRLTMKTTWIRHRQANPPEFSPRKNQLKRFISRFLIHRLRDMRRKENSTGKSI